MECSSIRLLSRKEVQKHPKTSRRKCEQRAAFSADIHRLYVQKKDQSETKSLSVTELHLPPNLKTFNTGASMRKWSQKRPRLKSTKALKKTPEPEAPSPRPEANQTNENIDTIEPDELDPDIQKLIAQASLESEGDVKLPKRRKKDSKSKIKKSRVVKYSLSKPASPQTVQVIRVKVTSNYLFEEAAVEKEESIKGENDCTRGHGRKYKRSFILNFNKMKEEEENASSLEIECRKVVLSSRKKDDSMV